MGRVLYAGLQAVSGGRRHVFLYGELAGAEAGHVGAAYRYVAGGSAGDAAGAAVSHRRLGGTARPRALHLDFAAGDDDFSNRWKAIKIRFVQTLPRSERRSPVRTAKGERGIWQRRSWEHAIRDERDYAGHVDYIHYNPVKHGCVARVADWPHSTFHRYVQRCVYPPNWAGTPASEFETGEKDDGRPF
jgi:hypothetical protein